MSTQRSVFITGANRGIGLGLTLKFLQGGYQVYAAARNPDGARELWELEHSYPGRCKVLELDVTSAPNLKRLASELADVPLDILINNAGYLAERGGRFSELSEEALTKSLAINTIAPIQVMQTLLPNLKLAKQPVAAVISSSMGSLSETTSGGYYAYRMSKAAINMLIRTFAADHPKIVAVALHPGWVQTEMGGSGASLSVKDSTAGLYEVIAGLKLEDSAKFLDYRGKEVRW